ncbi:MAG TPA: GNAT family N-acetyltransferase [Acidimicrobiales bacterium]|nr:GNAT family N-acetyltransferase [Acidimicrobiales bacterium]
MEVGAREATEHDRGIVDALTALAIAEQVDSRGGSVWAVREAMRDPGLDATTFVGTVDDTVVGFARVGVDELADSRRLGIVTQIYVDPGAREVSIGELLLDACIEWCRSRGCIGVDAHALPGNRETKNFFETAGLTARLIVVHKAL